MRKVKERKTGYAFVCISLLTHLLSIVFRWRQFSVLLYVYVIGTPSCHLYFTCDWSFEVTFCSFYCFSIFFTLFFLQQTSLEKGDKKSAEKRLATRRSHNKRPYRVTKREVSQFRVGEVPCYRWRCTHWLVLNTDIASLKLVSWPLTLIPTLNSSNPSSPSHLHLISLSERMVL